MSGLFQGLEIGKRALLTHQVSMQTIGHNIANVNTIGYTRQRVTIVASAAQQGVYGTVGSGVTVSDVRSIRDLFLGEQHREAQKDLGEWSYRAKTMTQIESTFNEPNDGALNELIGEFWDSWDELSNNPEATTSGVVSAANQLINGMNQRANALESLRDSVDRDMASMVEEINRITAEIASINGQIQRQEVGSSNANDLRDQRNYLTDQLASYIDVNVIENPNGTSTVSMGAMILVDQTSTLELGYSLEREGTQVTHRLAWKGTDVELTNAKGQLAGLIQSRDEIIPRYREQLDTLARTIVEQVNAIHRTGYGANGDTDIDFFDPNFTDAASIRLNPDVENDPSMIAVSRNEDIDVRDSLNAAAISDLRYETVLGNNTQTIEEYYSSLIGDLGVESREATSFTENFELLTEQIDSQRQSVEGVSLDEEMANLVKFEHAYEAAARVITAMDQALDVVISSMGIVGR